MAAFYNGVNLGFIFEMNTVMAPRARQVNAYCGAEGLEVLDHGSRGGITVVDAAIIVTIPGLLASALASLRALQFDGGAYVLVDDLGVAWPGVILAEFRPKGRKYQTVGQFGLNGLAQKYEAEFLHVL